MGKVPYRVVNWKQYNEALINRGKLTVWLDDELLENWASEPVGLVGRPQHYSDAAITFCYTIKALFSLPLRQCQGLVSSVFELSKIDMNVPHYTSICKRIKMMALPQISEVDSAVHVAVDATGMKIYGEGEWKMRTHGKEKRRTWRKIHMAVDAETKEILVCVMTEANVHDSEMVGELLSHLKKADFVYGDGAYDNKSSYDAAESIGACGVFPPRSGACVSKLSTENPPETQRDINILGCDLFGEKDWKIMMCYGLRNLSENVFFRLKIIFGEKLKSRTGVRQAFEVAIKMKLLNDFRALGMPVSFAIG